MNSFVVLAAWWLVSAGAVAEDPEPPVVTATSNLAVSLDESEAGLELGKPATLEPEEVAVTLPADPLFLNPPSLNQPPSENADLAATVGLLVEGAVETEPDPVRATRLRRSERLGPAARRSEPLPWYRGVTVSLVVVLAVIGGVALLLRRLVPSFRSASGGLVEVVGRSHLSPKQSLNLVRVGRRLVLVGATAEGMTALCEIDDPQEVMEILARVPGSRALGSGGFEAALNEASLDFEGDDLDSGEVTQMPSANRLDEARGRVQGLLVRLRAMQEHEDEPGEPATVGGNGTKDRTGIRLGNK